MPCTPLLEKRPLAYHGPWSDLGHPLTVDIDLQHAIEHQVELVAGLPLLREQVSRCSRLRPGFSPPRMMLRDNSRSSADSPLVTTAGEFSWPHVLCVPYAVAYQSRKSVSPDLATRCPVWS